MSFSSKVKAELCTARLDKRCCALAEVYGVLLFCRRFSPDEISIVTASEEFAHRLPRLFKKALGVKFDALPLETAKGKCSFSITDADKIRGIYDAFGLDVGTLSLHLNLGILEEACDKAAFLRGAFLAGGSVTDPEKRFHFELATGHYSVSKETAAVADEMGQPLRSAQRKGNYLLYLKQADAIADFLTTIGAAVSSMDIASAKVEKDMRNTINRKVNCDSANADKVVAAAAEQMAAIRFLDQNGGLDALPDKLQEAALLRIANPEASLADLSQLSFPSVSKSCLSHRLKKIVDLAEKEKEASEKSDS